MTTDRTPAMPLWIDDYEAATAHLSIEEDGAYMRLLRLCWRMGECRIPDRREWIRRMMRATNKEFDTIIEPVIEEFFTRSRGYIYQKRQKREWEYVQDLKEKRSKAGKKGGKKSAKLRDQNVSRPDGPLNGDLLEGAENGQSGPSKAQPPYPDPTHTSKVEEDVEDTHKENGPIEVIVSAWNSMAAEHGLQSIRTMSEKRTRTLRKRLDDYSADDIVAAIKDIPKNDFLMGGGGRGWVAHFNWLMRPDSVALIHEGHYRNGEDDGYV